MASRLLLLGLTFVIVTTTAPAMAQLCGPTETSLSARANRIAQFETMYDEVVEKIERVPPDVAKFIDTEHQAAISQQNISRFQLVFQNPYFHPQQVFTHLGVIKENLAAARSAKSVADQVVYLSVVLSRHADFAEAFSAYVDFDSNRPKRVLQKGDVQSSSMISTMAKMQLLQTLQCGVRQMREP